MPASGAARNAPARSLFSSAARFRDLGLYLFDSGEEAELFLNHSLLRKAR